MTILLAIILCFAGPQDVTPPHIVSVTVGSPIRRIPLGHMAPTVMKNWLKPLPAGECHGLFGDFTQDRVVDLVDFGVLAKYYRGELKSPPPSPLADLAKLLRLLL